MRTRTKKKIPKRPQGEDYFGLAIIVPDPANATLSWLIFIAGTWRQIHAGFDAITKPLAELGADCDFFCFQGHAAVERKLEKLEREKDRRTGRHPGAAAPRLSVNTNRPDRKPTSTTGGWQARRARA